MGRDLRFFGKHTREEKRRAQRKVRLLVLTVLVVGALSVYFLGRSAASKAGEALAAGNLEEARSAASRWTVTWPHQAKADKVLAFLDAVDGKEGEPNGVPPLTADQAHRLLFSKGKNGKTSALYLAAVSRLSEEPGWMTGALDLALAAEDEALIQALAKDGVPESFREAVDRSISDGFAVITAADGTPLVRRKKDRLEVNPLVPGLEPYLTGLQPQKGEGPWRSTIDPELQAAAWEAFGGMNGHALVADLEGNLLAAVSKGGTWDFEDRFLPASTMKLFTAAAALRTGTGDIFPFVSKPLRVGDGLIYDWRDNGTVDSLERALAISCNPCFARMVLDMDPLWSKERTRMGFNGSWEFAGRSFELGKMKPNPEHDQKVLARSGIGLEGEDVTLLHLLLMTEAIAREGVVPELKLFTERRTQAGLSAELALKRSSPDRWLEAPHADKLMQGMVRAVTDEDGTGFKARLDDERMPAMKTGTYGGGGEPFSAVVVMQVPARSPKYVAVVHLPGQGKAAKAGASWARRFALAAGN